jgi:hypothetical protein
MCIQKRSQHLSVGYEEHHKSTVYCNKQQVTRSSRISKKSVGVVIRPQAARQMNPCSIPRSFKEFSLLQNAHNGPGTQPVPYFKGTVPSFSGGKATGA